MGIQNSIGFYPIRVQVWLDFYIHRVFNMHKSIPYGLMDTDLFLRYIQTREPPWVFLNPTKPSAYSQFIL
jgi:hypothetical protein